MYSDYLKNGHSTLLFKSFTEILAKTQYKEASTQQN